MALSKLTFYQYQHTVSVLNIKCVALQHRGLVDANVQR